MRQPHPRGAVGGRMMDRNFVRFIAFVIGLWAAGAAALMLALALLGMAGRSAEAPSPRGRRARSSPSWRPGRTASRCTTPTLDGWSVLVDHETGVQYVVGNTAHTVCPLLDADGTPLLVAEAGE